MEKITVRGQHGNISTGTLNLYDFILQFDVMLQKLNLKIIKTKQIQEILC